MKQIIEDTFNDLTEMYPCNNVNTSIVFPNYADKKTIRVSEQELRTCLIKNLLKGGYSRISVETPTNLNYRFKGGVRVGEDCEDEHSESARIDLTLLDETKNYDTIFELKAHARTRSVALYKDFVKLSMEKAKTKCFVMIFEDMNPTQRKKFIKKFRDCFEDDIDEKGYLRDKMGTILEMCFFHDVTKKFDETFSKQLKSDILNYDPNHP